MNALTSAKPRSKNASPWCSKCSNPESAHTPCLQIYTNIYTDQIFFFFLFQDFECLEFTLFCIATVIFPLVTGVRKLSGNKTEALLEKHDTEGGCLSHPYWSLWCPVVSPCWKLLAESFRMALLHVNSMDLVYLVVFSNLNDSTTGVVGRICSFQGNPWIVGLKNKWPQAMENWDYGDT